MIKKIAFYVEGLTEQYFIQKLLLEIAGQKNITIELQKFQGTGRPKKIIVPRNKTQSVNTTHYALIVDCGGDGGVKPRILEDYQRLFSKGYSEIIGLLDLYPRQDLNKFENVLIKGTKSRGRIINPPLPNGTHIVIAVKEVEAWFLSECKHFDCIDKQLTNALIVNNMGFNPCTDDMTLRTHPAQDLHDIYKLVDKAYMDSQGKKSKNRVERTIDCLDYLSLYIEIKNRISKLNELISKIDGFLT